MKTVPALLAQVRSQDCYEIYHELEVAEAEEVAWPLMVMRTAMTEHIPLPDPHTIRHYMASRE